MAAAVYYLLNLLSPPTRTLVDAEPTLYDPENIKDPDADAQDVVPEEKGLRDVRE